jgi:hypothetical protein
MGQRIRDTYVHSNLCQLNLRFGPDELGRVYDVGKQHRCVFAFTGHGVGSPGLRRGW